MFVPLPFLIDLLSFFIKSAKKGAYVLLARDVFVLLKNKVWMFVPLPFIIDLLSFDSVYWEAQLVFILKLISFDQYILKSIQL